MNYFQRQMELQDFDQTKINDKTALILGVGGIGTNIAIACCRLGFKKLILLDYDIVEDHNLNRQQLYTKRHIGLSKVDCALESLQQHHNLTSEIEIYNVDALKKWQLVLYLIKKSDIVFNTIDYGDHFDYAISCACYQLNTPMILGGTEPFYGHLVSTFLQTSENNDPCYACAHDIHKMIDREHIFNYQCISFLPKDSQPDKGGSTVYSAAICSHLIVSQYITYLMKQENYQTKHQVILRLINLDLDTFVCRKNDCCTICG